MDVANETSQAMITNFKRKIIIEPLMIGYMFFVWPFWVITTQYILNDIRAEHGINNTDKTPYSCDSNSTSDLERSLEARAQSEASYFQLWIALSQGVPSIIAMLFLGNYSDKAGRRFLISPPCIGTTLMSMCFVLVIALNASRYYLLIGIFFYGISGSLTCLVSGCFAYIADTTSAERYLSC